MMDASTARPRALSSIGENSQHWDKVLGELGGGGLTEEREGEKRDSRLPWKPEADWEIQSSLTECFTFSSIRKLDLPSSGN